MTHFALRLIEASTYSVGLGDPAVPRRDGVELREHATPTRRREVVVAIEPRALTVEVAAGVYGLSETTLREAIAAGALPARRHGRRVVVLVAEADEWVRSLPMA